MTYIFKKFRSQENTTFFLFIKSFFLCWLIIAILYGIEHIYFDSNYELFTLKGFALLLAEALPVFFVFGFLPLVFMVYSNYKEKKNVKRT